MTDRPKRRLNSQQSEAEREVRRVEALVDGVIKKKIGDMAARIEELEKEAKGANSILYSTAVHLHAHIVAVANISAALIDCASESTEPPSARLDSLIERISLALPSTYGDRESCEDIGALYDRHCLSIPPTYDTPLALSVRNSQGGVVRPRTLAGVVTLGRSRFDINDEIIRRHLAARSPAEGRPREDDDELINFGHLNPGDLLGMLDEDED